MLVKKVTLISFLLLMVGMYTPSYAVVATPTTIENVETAQKEGKKKKKMSFREKIRLFKQIRSEAKAAKKQQPKGTQSVFQDSMFLVGLIMLLAGAVVSALGIFIVSWLAGLVALAGFILVVIALVRYFR